MADVSNVRTNWENVSHQDWLENNAKAQANNISGSEMNALGNAIQSVNGEVELATLGVSAVNTRIDNLDLGGGGFEFDQTHTLPDSDTMFAAIRIPDDGSPSGDWPDRFAFFFQHPTQGWNRTGYFNEYGELRARPAKDNTVGFRSFARWDAPVDQEHFQITVDQLSDVMFAVDKEYINVYAEMRDGDTRQPLAKVIVIDQGETPAVGTKDGTVIVIRPL